MTGRFSRTALAAAWLVVATTPARAQRPVAPERLAIRAAHMIDVVAGRRVDNASC